MHTRLEGDESVLARLRLYALLAPHLEGGGAGNNGYLAEVAGHKLLMAHEGKHLAGDGRLEPVPAPHRCGYVGHSDGWTDLADNFQMDWEFDSAENGNIALTGEIDLSHAREFTLAVALGDSCRTRPDRRLLQSLGVPFAEQRERFLEQWHRVCGHMLPLAKPSRRRRRTVSPQPQLAAGPRGQELSRAHDRLAEHSLGRSEGRRGPGRLPPGLAARHGPHAPRRYWPRATRTLPIAR